MLYSVDTGQSGNLFAGNFFDFNQKHLNGYLMQAFTSRSEVEL
jgi:hypothetical protein